MEGEAGMQRENKNKTSSLQHEKHGQIQIQMTCETHTSALVS